jgi:hypothetical protein
MPIERITLKIEELDAGDAASKQKPAKVASTRKAEGTTVTESKTGNGNRALPPVHPKKRATVKAPPASGHPAPQLIVVVPYRDRAAHLNVFATQMPFVLEEYARDPDRSVEVVVCHQCDDRPFNRGAMKNIGYMYAVTTYGEEAADAITFAFQDVDLFPARPGTVDYLAAEAEPGAVHHHFGFSHALGGLVSMKGGVFRKLGGFPNVWGWGCEDNGLQMKCEVGGVPVSRENFFELDDMEIHHCFDTSSKTVTNNKDLFLEFVRRDCLADIDDLELRVEGLPAGVNANTIGLVNARLKRPGGIRFVVANALKWSVPNKYSAVEKKSSASLRVAKLNESQRRLRGSLQREAMSRAGRR